LYAYCINQTTKMLYLIIMQVVGLGIPL
jgi:hypothetical protein